MIDIVIRSIRARAINVPLEYPIRTASGTVHTSPLVLIDLETDAGITGCAYIFAYIPPALQPLAHAVSSLGELLIGQPLAPVDLSMMLEKRLRLIGNQGLLRMASSGLDMAAWDALAKINEVPLTVLLGGKPRPIRSYDSHAMDGRELAIERARRSANMDFSAIKTKVGYDTLDEDLQVVSAIRAETGLNVMVDYNQSLTVPEAIRRSRALDEQGVIWIEEPTLQQDYDGYRRIGEAIRSPIQMGENWCGIDEMHKALEAGAAPLAMVDIMKIGGVTGWLAASGLAQARGIPLSSHLFQEFSAHMLAVTPSCDWLERMDIAGPIIEPTLTFADGYAHIGDLPGAGLIWREEEISRYLA